MSKKDLLEKIAKQLQDQLGDIVADVQVVDNRKGLSKDGRKGLGRMADSIEYCKWSQLFCTSYQPAGNFRKTKTKTMTKTMTAKTKIRSYFN
jgi:hypothetical protein